MGLTVVSLAYPIVPIGPDTVGGTEQVVASIDEALVRRGHRSIVVGAEGSRVAGTLVSTPTTRKPLDECGWEEAYAEHREALHHVLQNEDVDVVHMHGIDFHAYLPDGGPAALATLHLPPFNYPSNITSAHRPLFLNCVSGFSRRQYPAQSPMVTIPNGVALDRFRPGSKKEDFVVGLGRIVEEKGFHLAIDAAKKAGLPLVLGGSVPPFPEHQRYFEQEIRPRLDAERRFLGPIPLRDRIDLLARARCAIVPSLFDEPFSLVTAEALASGTPVVACPIGALTENVEHGRTGLFARDAVEMAEAMREITRIDPRECRRVACERFSSERMASSYLELYEMLAAMGRFEALRRASWEHSTLEFAHP
jgi:glycosyltransferase involved in cell wall biosynthesis